MIHVVSTLALGALALGAVSAAAQDSPSIELELNTVEQAEAACRLTFTVQNRTGAGIDSLVYETVLFDAEGAVAALTLFDFREVPEGALRVRQFDLADTDCQRLGGILLNGVASCTIGGAESDACANATEFRSRTAIEVLR